MDVIRTRIDALAAILGLACIVWGVALLSVAGAFIAAGVGCIAFALFPWRRGG